MTQLNRFEQWIADTAMGYLRYDDDNPDVGFGLFQGTAIDYAFKDFKNTATLFAGGYDFALLQVNRKNIEDYVSKKRRR